VLQFLTHLPEGGENQEPGVSRGRIIGPEGSNTGGLGED